MSGEKKSPIELSIDELRASFLNIASSIGNAASSIKDAISAAKHKRDMQRIEAYNLLIRKEIEVLISEFKQIHKACSEVAEMPDISFLPELAALQQMKTGQLEQALSSLRSTIDECKKNMTSAMLEAIKKNKAPLVDFEKTSFDIQKSHLPTLMNKYALAQVSGRSVKDRAVATQYAEKAKLMLDDIGNEHHYFSLSTECQTALKEVFNSESASASQEAYARFESFIKRDLDIQKQQFTAKQEKKKQLAKQKKQLMVATVVSQILKKIGYEVSDTSNDFFVENGKVIARKDKFKDHGVILTFNEDASEITTSPIRTTGAGEVLTKDLEARYLAEDSAFDAHWCSREQLGQLIKESEKAGIKMGFKKTNTKQGLQHSDKTGMLERVNANDLPKQESYLEEERQEGNVNARSI